MKKEIKLEIIEATDSHVPKIIKIWVEFMDYHRDIDPFFKRRKDGHKNAEMFIRDSLKSEDSLVLVAIEDGKVAGYSIAVISKHPPVLESEKYGFIEDMAIKSKYRRKGIGTEMLTRILEWFESKDINRIELKVLPENHPGYSFWKKHGFRNYIHFLYLDR